MWPEEIAIVEKRLRNLADVLDRLHSFGMMTEEAYERLVRCAKSSVDEAHRIVHEYLASSSTYYWLFI
jgi:hypothetical protein